MDSRTCAASDVIEVAQAGSLVTNTFPPSWGCWRWWWQIYALYRAASAVTVKTDAGIYICSSNSIATALAAAVAAMTYAPCMDRV